MDDGQASVRGAGDTAPKARMALLWNTRARHPPRLEASIAVFAFISIICSAVLSGNLSMQCVTEPGYCSGLDEEGRPRGAGYRFLYGILGPLVTLIWAVTNFILLRSHPAAKKWIPTPGPWYCMAYSALLMGGWAILFWTGLYIDSWEGETNAGCAIVRMMMACAVMFCALFYFITAIVALLSRRRGSKR